MQVADKTRDVRGTVILAVVCLVLQLALAPNIALGNGRANFALIFSACIALQAGGTRGVIAGFLAGLVFDLSSTAPIGLMAFCLSLAGYALSFVSRDAAGAEFGPRAIRAALGALAVSLVYHLAMLLVGEGGSFFDIVFLRTLPTALLTAVVTLPFLFFLSRLRSSGPSLGSGPGGGSHLSRRGV